jgi:hypothetical protein
LIKEKCINWKKVNKVNLRQYNTLLQNDCDYAELRSSCLTAIKAHVIRYCETVYKNTGKNLFWSVKNSTEILDKFKVKNYQASSVSTYDLSTPYTTLPHNLINDKLLSLIQKTLQVKK